MTAIANRRRRTLAFVVVGAVVAAGLGFVAGRSIKSPADAAAEPPEASLITVPVELRELASNVITRGDAHREQSKQISIDSSAGAAIGGAAVVTALSVQVGDLLEEGSVLVEITERPVIALGGELPMFRNLGPGSQGDDVTQLQEALVRIGINVSVDGMYGELTERAVEQLYARIGYPAPGLTNDEQALLSAARDNRDAAQSALKGALFALTELQAPLPESQRLQIELSLQSAKDAVDLAEAVQIEANAAATAGVSAATVALTASTDARYAAADRLAQANRGRHPDTNLSPTAEELVELEAALAAAEEDLVNAVTQQAAAEAAIDLVATQQQQFVDLSETQLTIAQALYDETLAGPSTSGAVQAIDDAQRVRDQATLDLQEIEASTGIRLPLAEVIFLRGLPSQVQSLDAKRGDFITGQPVMTVSGAEVTIESAVSASDRPLLSEGDVVYIDDESLGIDLAGTIVFLADDDGGLAPDGRFFMRVAFDERPEVDIVGRNLRITIPITSTSDQVLTVPLAALAAGADGSVRVEVEDPDRSGVTRTVTVTTGLEAIGLVEVVPVDGELAAGDRVVIGQQ